nr:MAG TPA: hypothetical protein [Caudoviricetes sp.]
MAAVITSNPNLEFYPSAINPYSLSPRQTSYYF